MTGIELAMAVVIVAAGATVQRAVGFGAGSRLADRLDGRHVRVAVLGLSAASAVAAVARALA